MIFVHVHTVYSCLTSPFSLEAPKNPRAGQVQPFRPSPRRWPTAAALPVAAWLEGLPLRPRCTPSSSEVRDDMCDMCNEICSLKM